MADFLRQFIAHNRMLEGGFVIEDRLLTLADIDCPILSVVGTVDEIAPAAGVRAIRLAAPRADVYELALQAGHFGLVVGSTSNRVTWPTVAAWARWRDGEGERPEPITEVPDDPSAELEPAGPQPGRLRARAGRRGRHRRRPLDGRDGAADRARHARAGPRGGRPAAAAGPAGAGPAEHPDLARPARRTSACAAAPDDIFFLFEDRAHSARRGQRADRQRRPRA